ncbi:patatin-like phospholipase [Colletotrichum somersetense]|nr:patatin-like phospholipase [Colletotrichum somersetense]
MLGRLDMDVEECIKAYQNLMLQIFPKNIVDSAADTASKLGDLLGVPGFVKSGVRFISSPFMKAAGALESGTRAYLTGGKWEASELEKVIKELIDKRLPERDGGADGIPLWDKDTNTGCKVFVTAVNMEEGNVRSPVLLRSYENPQEKSVLPDIKIWEAARATSAAPTYLAPLKVGEYHFVDGGLQANNPLGWLWNEVITTFGPDRQAACFLSLGTGVPPSQELPSAQGDLADPVKPLGMISGLAGIATNAENVNILFRSLINALAPPASVKKYWRFSVGDGLCDWVTVNGVQKWRIMSPKAEKAEYIAMDDPAMRDIMRKLALEYIESDEGKKMVKACAEQLSSVVAP